MRIWKKDTKVAAASRTPPPNSLCPPRRYSRILFQICKHVSNTNTILLLSKKVNKLKSFIQSAKASAKHDFSLFYLDQRRQAAVAFCINIPYLKCSTFAFYAGCTYFSLQIL